MDNNNIETESKKLFSRIPISLWLLVAYAIIALPILVWHERHLPIPIILMLTLSALAFGMGLLLLSNRVFSKFLEHGFHPIYEAVILGGFALSLGLSGFLENSGGRVFLMFFAFLTLILRLTKVKLYYGINLLAMLLLTNGLLSFLVLQKMEVFTAYHLFRSRFQFTEVDLSDWKMDPETRILTNRSIPLELKLPEDMHFHNPQDLSIKDKTGAGQIAGIISYSERDPNSYPFIRIFFFPVYVPVEKEAIKEEVIKYIQYQEKQGEIEEVNEIQPNRDFRFHNRIPSNAFWTFYDIFRPRYSKTGFYYFESKTGSKVLFHLTENLVKGNYHEPSIRMILDSLRLE